MALDKFRAPPLPNPPAQYDAQYFRQVIRVIENYFSQLDSSAANNANQYTAVKFIGGTFNGAFPSYTTTQKNALTTALVVAAGTVIFDTTLGKLCVYTGSAWQTITSA